MTGSFAFSYGPRLVSGAGCAERIADLLPEGPVLFVTDAMIIKLGLAQGALAALAASGRDVTIASEVEADPSRITLEAVVALGRKCGAASVVGFGGGSPMDVAKLAAYLLGSGDDLDAIWGVGNARGKGLPLVLAPTTAGTGSEATPVSIITLPGDEKRGVSSTALVAAYAVLDPVLTLGLPQHVTAATGMDAMVHAIEAYTSAHLKNPMSDLLAREALRLLAANLLVACEEPGNMAAREAMLLGAHLAGVAFANAPVAGVHALAYPLGGHFHVPHGLSNVLMLPHVLGFNMNAAMPLYAQLGPLVDPALDGLGQQAQAQGLLEALRDMAAKAGMPAQLTAVGVSADDLDQLAADAMLQERLLKNNPRPITLRDARQLYEAAL
ncbi:iron-containing alcohol dehydrogenase [Novosphingobium guangzhouense]|uniref:Alcohol dehydrogenase 2 n=1 Tax=Novosphingobium guangzhouense TaxID=1850347 RepID=A0A2K2G3A2_9SPHN|nr:iron-containing alcohol dehydrogenase [Novosphingobium guangzhouense]PNU05520.1 alcohol dehydrogenase [Novosphingobium guangzhouense]